MKSKIEIVNFGDVPPLNDPERTNVALSALDTLNSANFRGMGYTGALAREVAGSGGLPRSLLIRGVSHRPLLARLISFVGPLSEPRATSLNSPRSVDIGYWMTFSGNPVAELAHDPSVIDSHFSLRLPFHNPDNMASLQTRIANEFGGIDDEVLFYKMGSVPLLDDKDLANIFFDTDFPTQTSN